MPTIWKQIIMVLLLCFLLAACANVEPKPRPAADMMREAVAVFFEKDSYENIVADEFASVTEIEIGIRELRFFVFDKYEGSVKADELYGPVDDVGFLEDFPNLKRLKLSIPYTLEGLEQISRLQNLEFLGLEYIDMDHSCLSELKKLSRLSVALGWKNEALYQYITTLPLRPKLSLSLYIHKNGPGDDRRNENERFRQIAALTNVTNLYLSTWSGTNLDLAPLAGLRKLSRLHLEMYGEYECTDSLAGLTNLTYLKMDFEGETLRLAPFRELINLEELELFLNGQAIEFSCFEKMAALKFLDISFYGGTPDYAPFAGLTGLNTLFLSPNTPQSFATMPTLPAVEYLNVGGAEDLNFLSSFPAIKELSARVNTSQQNIELNLMGLKHASELEQLRLRLYNRRIKEPVQGAESQEMPDESRVGVWLALEGLESCQKLEEIYISHIRLRSLEALRYLKGLHSLTLSNNEITKIDTLRGLDNLVYLSLDDNKIVDISPLTGNAGIETISLCRNPLDVAVVRSVLPTLPSLIGYNDDNYETSAWMKENLPDVQSVTDDICNHDNDEYK